MLRYVFRFFFRIYKTRFVMSNYMEEICLRRISYCRLYLFKLHSVSAAQLIHVFYYTIHATPTLNSFVCVEFQIFVCEFEWNCFARIEDSSEF
jgi:hypothetical protein